MSWRETTLTILNAATESGVLDLAQFGARRKKDIGFIIPAPWSDGQGSLCPNYRRTVCAAERRLWERLRPDRQYESGLIWDSVRSRN
jgi:hypothetical protein